MREQLKEYKDQKKEVKERQDEEEQMRNQFIKSIQHKQAAEKIQLFQARVSTSVSKTTDEIFLSNYLFQVFPGQYSNLAVAMRVLLEIKLLTHVFEL